jgi:hypothetical protein
MVKLSSMEILNQKSSIVEETRLGIYVWEMPDGRWIGDDDGNFLSVTSTRGNKSKIDALAREVRSYGIDVGQPKFLSGRRKIDDEEFEHQSQRLQWGLIPDPLDIGNYKDGALRNGKVK